MLKRYQILLDDWIADFIKYIADKYDFSFSEVIRLYLCMFAGEMTSAYYPNYKFPLNSKKLANSIKKGVCKKVSEEEKHKMLSKIYFEARKAMEFRLAKEKKNK